MVKKNKNRNNYELKQGGLNLKLPDLFRTRVKITELKSIKTLLVRKATGYPQGFTQGFTQGINTKGIYVYSTRFDTTEKSAKQTAVQIKEFADYIENINYVRFPFAILHKFIEISGEKFGITDDNITTIYNTFDAFINGTAVSHNCYFINGAKEGAGAGDGDGDATIRFEYENIVDDTKNFLQDNAGKVSNIGKVSNTANDNIQKITTEDIDNIINFINLSFCSNICIEGLFNKIIAIFKKILLNKINLQYIRRVEDSKLLQESGEFMKFITKLKESAFKRRFYDITTHSTEYLENLSPTYIPLSIYIKQWDTTVGKEGPGPKTFSNDVAEAIIYIVKDTLKNLNDVTIVKDTLKNLNDVTIEASMITGDSKKRSSKKKGGMAFELNPAASPMTQFDLANGYSTLQNGGKKKSKKKMGGADPNLGGTSAFYNTSSLVPTASPVTMAEAPVAAAGAVTPFSSGMPNYASVEYGLPPVMTNALSGGLDNKQGGGGRRSKKVKKAGGIMDDVGTIFSRMREGRKERDERDDERKEREDEHKEREEIVGGKKKKKSKGGESLKTPLMGGVHHEKLMGGETLKKPLMGGKKKKSNGGGDTLAQLLKVQSGGLNSNSPGSFDWKTQIGLDAQGNMAGGKKRSKSKK